MAAPIGVIFTTQEAERIDATVKAYEKKPQYVLPRKKRKRLTGSGSGRSACTKVVKIWYVGNELPTGGSVTVPMIYDGNSGSPSWAYNASQSTIESAIASAISGLSSSDITVLFGQSATAGTAFGNWPITIAFPDVTLWSANGDITDTFTFASGTVPHIVLGDVCCE